MTPLRNEEMLDHVLLTSPYRLIALEEFRLRAEDSADRVERVVMGMPRTGGEAAVPLLTSVDDPRDVAMLRTVDDHDSKEADREERAALAPFVTSWRPLKRYRLRVAESAQAPPSHYRMAVTESGINDVDGDHLTLPWSDPAVPEAANRIALLWIGAPVGTSSGLLVLVGHYGEGPFAGHDGGSDWPLALNRRLGVRVYETIGNEGVGIGFVPGGLRATAQIRAH